MSSSSDNDDGNVVPANKDPAAAEKEKLLRDIKDLECIVKQCEWKLETLNFKDVEERAIEKSSQNPASSTSLRTPNVDIDLLSDLYRFAGFSCVKFRRDEVVFNFTSTNEQQKDNTYGLQIFIKNNQGHLGKWVMPMSIDMNHILSKTPIDKLKGLTPFVKNCKHHVDCYTVRKEQYLSLKKRTSLMKNCTLQSDIGFKRINLELYGVHDCENDRYINLIVYLLYHADKARPSKIDVATTNQSQLSNDTKRKLKAYVKEFKKSDLETAFDKIVTDDNSTFKWTQEDDTDSPLDLNDTSSSEENFLDQLRSNRKRSLRKRKQRRELQKKSNERKRQRDTTNVESSEDKESSDLETEASRTESPRKIRKKETKKVRIRGKKADRGTSISEQEKINKNLEETPFHKPKDKLKQTKLNFRAKVATNTNEKSLFESKLHNKPNSKQSRIAELVTSTPLRRSGNIRKGLSLSSLESNNIPTIKKTRQRANELDDSQNSDELGNKTPEKNNRILRSNTKTTRSSPVLKTYQRLTRSMIKG